MNTIAMWRKTIFVLLFFGAGCSAYMASLQSSFFSKFSLRNLVERNESTAGLNCSQSAGGGGGASFGTGGVGQKESNFNRLESLSCQIRDVKAFDEQKFIQALKASVEQDLKDSKATIVSSKNADATSFQLEYALSNVKGTIDISATRGPDRFYTLNANLNEKSKE